MEKTLTRLYTDPKEPSAFSGIEKLLAAARQHYPYITRNRILQFLQKQHTYTLFKPTKTRFKRLRTIPTGWHSDWQCDLMHMSTQKRVNKSYRYILVCIDVLSRYIFLEPLRNKSTASMKSAFESIFSRSPHLPWRLYSGKRNEGKKSKLKLVDAGTEFVSKELREFFKQNSIEKVEACTHPVLHATLAERAIRTVREKLNRYLYENRTIYWHSILPDIEHAINHSIHSVTKQRPVDINHKNAEKVWQQLYAGAFQVSHAKKKPRFEKGATVRVSNQRQTFKKGSNTFSDEIYRICRVLSWREPHVYEVEHLTNKSVKGYYYDSELCAVSWDSMWQVERVLKTRRTKNTTEYFVKWKTRPSKDNCWIRASDLV